MEETPGLFQDTSRRLNQVVIQIVGKSANNQPSSVHHLMNNVETARYNQRSCTLNMPLFRLFSFFPTNFNIYFLQQIYVKNVHPVYGAGIQTHNRQIASLIP